MRPMVRERYPAWEDRIRFWAVKDLGEEEGRDRIVSSTPTFASCSRNSTRQFLADRKREVGAFETRPASHDVSAVSIGW